MDNYIVRIYRRDVNDPRRIAGMVELVEQEEMKAFAGIEELVGIFVAVPGKGARIEYMPAESHATMKKPDADRQSG